MPTRQKKTLGRMAILDPALEPGFLRSLPQHLLITVIKAYNKERRARYRNNRRDTPKFGNLNKGFTASEREHFLERVSHPKAKLAYTVMAYGGLRIGEVHKLHIENIYLEQRQLYLETLKSGTADVIYLHDRLYDALKTYIETYRTQILANNGWLLWSDRSTTGGPQPVTTGWLRNHFNAVRKQAELAFIYGRSDERPGRKPRRLYRLTTHSFRHGFGTAFQRSSKNIVETKAALRHRSIRSTERYTHATQDEVNIVLKRAFQKPAPAEEVTIDF